jgi:hypothetical protein
MLARIIRTKLNSHKFCKSTPFLKETINASD